MTADDLIHRICIYRGVSVLQARGPSRVASITRVRHEAMWILREATELSLPEIARKLGRYDHTTALSAIRKIQAAVTDDPLYGDQLREIGMMSAKAQRDAVERDVAWLTIELESRKQRLRDLVRRRRKVDKVAA